MLKTQRLFCPAWFQQHQDEYLDKVLALSDKQISLKNSSGWEIKYE